MLIFDISIMRNTGRDAWVSYFIKLVKCYKVYSCNIDMFN